MSITPALIRGLAVTALAAITLTACSGGSTDEPAKADPSARASFQADPGATPTPSAGPSAAPSETPEPSATDTPAAMETTAAPDVPTEAQARALSDEFLGDLKDELYNLAWLTMCDAGRERFTNGVALQKELGLSAKTVTSYTLTGVTDDTFNGDPRKKVASDVVYSDGGTETLSLSITLEDGEAAVCGF